LDMGLAPGVLPGRVTLDDGRDWFERAWGVVPAGRGRNSAEMLAALSAGELGALILLGADPLGDFPDRTLAEQALGAGAFVVAVDALLSESAARADVVLPATVAHESPGTTTNIEGRVSRLGQKTVPPGQAWPDWMIAAELTARLGGDLGVTSVSELWDEIERLAPSHAGLTASVLAGDAGRDGIVVPLVRTGVTLKRRTTPHFDPVATPGIEAVERQGAPPRAGLAERIGGADADAPGASPSGRPSPMSWPQPLRPVAVPAVDGYSMRLVATRRLYDGGAAVEASESLAVLEGAAVLHVAPAELDRLGVTTGGELKVRSARGELVVDVLADADIPAGVVAMAFNVDDEQGAGASALIDAGAAVTDVRLETLS
ncbi:MAG: molybdopterin oxidoreductase family protein, partial [Acidimicrobiales bacterium]